MYYLYTSLCKYALLQYTRDNVVTYCQGLPLGASTPLEHAFLKLVCCQNQSFAQYGGSLLFLSACSSPTHGTLAEHHSTSPYWSIGTGAFLHRCLAPNFEIVAGSHSNDNETADQFLSLLVRRGPPQGTRTPRTARTSWKTWRRMDLRKCENTPTLNRFL